MTFSAKDLEKIDKMDPDPYSGKLFAYVYETGDEALREISKIALLKFYDRNALDFTVFKSAIFFESAVVEFSKKLVHSDENVVGSYTFGGTESVMLALKTARDFFFSRGKTGTPEIIVPASIHPSFLKAADYLGMKVKKARLNDKRKVNTEEVKELVNEKTALIAVSAPNWPFGTVDPVREVADISKDNEIPLHVDACLGGFMLPFLERLGEKVEPFDFRVEGVTSISMDVHKYGYSPKGASVVLFRNSEFKKYSLYVDTTSPGYVFVNPAVLSSRSVGPMAAAYATIQYLGEEGYLNLAKKTLFARNKILSGLKDLGFKPIGPVEFTILALENPDVDLFSFVTSMHKKGWRFHLQQRISDLQVPENIHLTISPIHHGLADEFIKDASDSIYQGTSNQLNQLLSDIKAGNLENIITEFINGKIDSSVVPILLAELPENVANQIVKEIVIKWYK